VTELEPILLQKLEPLDSGYEEGCRFRIVQIDGDVMHFANWGRAVQCIKSEGLRPVTEDEMDAIRKEIYHSE